MAINNHNNELGFTLIELIIVITILGVLSVIAAPKFIDVGGDARVAKLTQLAGTLKSTANMAHAKCLVASSCSENIHTSYVTFQNREYRFNYGWPDSGNALDANQIDAMIDYDGFTASLPHHTITRFSLDNSPDPLTCYVDYVDVFASSTLSINIVTEISGC